MYFVLLIISFILFYFILFNKNYNLSLFSSLTIFFILTIYNYNHYYLIIPIIIFFLSFIFKFNLKKNVLLINFILLFYIFFSIIEFLTHKYAMHCDKNSVISKIIEYIPFINTQYFLTCEKHIQHHLEVEPDMTLNENKYKESLFMGWDIFIHLFFAFLLSGILSKIISNYNISYSFLFILCIIVTFIWEYLWNKVHVKMHNYEINYSIKEGPYDENLFNLDIFKNILLQNHQNHHLQKGEKKGNYNVIVLGADEWFGYNNKKIDNYEYCKTNMNEKICK
jgi:hypothetical protein